MFLAKVHKGVRSLDAKTSFETSWLVINPGVYDTAVVACLMAGKGRLFLDDCQGDTRKTSDERKPRCQADDPTPDDCYFIWRFSHGLRSGDCSLVQYDNGLEFPGGCSPAALITALVRRSFASPIDA